MRLLSSHGELVRGRCRATNLCDYCAVQAAWEVARMLSLDALDAQAPELVAILGTRTASADPAPFYRGRELVLRALRRRWPGAEYACQCEFTTGYGPRAGGARRPHWNLLLKGVPVESADEARELVRRIWCEHVDAEPHAQYLEPLRDTAALMTYLALHFQKPAQAPPKGWTGQRFNASRGYFGERTRAEMRQLARASLQRDRDLWRAAQLHPGDSHRIQEAADEAAAKRADTTWRLWAPDLTRRERNLRRHHDTEVPDAPPHACPLDPPGRDAADTAPAQRAHAPALRARAAPRDGGRRPDRPAGGRTPGPDRGVSPRPGRTDRPASAGPPRPRPAP